MPPTTDHQHLAIGSLLLLGAVNAIYTSHLSPLTRLRLSPEFLCTLHALAAPLFALAFAVLLHRRHTRRQWPFDHPPSPHLAHLATLALGLGLGTYTAAFFRISFDVKFPALLSLFVLHPLALLRTGARPPLRRALLHLTLLTLAADLAFQLTTHLAPSTAQGRGYRPLSTLLYAASIPLALLLSTPLRRLDTPPPTLSTTDRRWALALTLALLTAAFLGPVRYTLRLRHERSVALQHAQRLDVIAEQTRAWLDQDRFSQIANLDSASAAFLQQLPPWTRELSDLSVTGPLRPDHSGLPLVRLHRATPLPQSTLFTTPLDTDPDTTGAYAYTPDRSHLHLDAGRTFHHQGATYRLSLRSRTPDPLD